MWRLVRVVESLVDEAVVGMSASVFGLYSQLRYGEPVTVSALSEQLGA